MLLRTYIHTYIHIRQLEKSLCNDERLSSHSLTLFHTNRRLPGCIQMENVQFSLCTFHTHIITHRSQTLALRMLSFYFVAFRCCPTARHIFLFPLCATLLLRCGYSVVCLYVRALQTRLHFHFSYFRTVFASHTHTYKRILLLCRFIIFHFMCARHV